MSGDKERTPSSRISRNFTVNESPSSSSSSINNINNNTTLNTTTTTATSSSSTPSNNGGVNNNHEDEDMADAEEADVDIQGDSTEIPVTNINNIINNDNNTAVNNPAPANTPTNNGNAPKAV